MYCSCIAELLMFLCLMVDVCSFTLTLMEGFQVDVILNSLKELQKEKYQNEKVLAEEYAKRKSLEAQLETTNAKLITTSDRSNKMKETLQVAELKVAQSQAQAKMFEQLNDERRERIAKINLQILEKEQEREQHMKQYESQMTTLTERFRSAWHNQSDDALELRLELKEKEKEECLAKISENQLLLNEFSKELEKAKAEKNSKQKLEALGGVPVETWKSTLALFRAENKGSRVATEDRQRKESVRIGNLESKRDGLKQQLDNLLADSTYHREQ